MTDGRRFRMLTVVDNCTRECLALVADTSISGLRVARELVVARLRDVRGEARALGRRVQGGGRPETIREDPALAVENVAAILGGDPSCVKRLDVETLNALKFSYARSEPQGGVVERDMHSGQQSVPLLSLSARGSSAG